MDLLAWTVAILALLTALAIFAVAHQPALTHHRAGKAFAFMAFFILPLAITGLGTAAHMEKAKTTEFCLSCHDMAPYGKSMHYDDKEALPAVHFQNHLVPPERACFTCHTTYTMFGDVKAKMTGMKHLWIYYFGTTPNPIKLYEPYQNRECLSCHGASRSFLEGETHKELMVDLRAGKTSCLECHSLVHDVANAKDYSTWMEPAHE